MRIAKTRMTDSTFEINLAPFLDIVVSVVPLLLLSVVFVEIKMIETPVPQVVQQAIEKDQKNQDPEAVLNLRVDLQKGFSFEIQKKGDPQPEILTIPLKGGQLDFQTLQEKASILKNRFPQIFKLGLAPEGNVPLQTLIKSMDAVRRQPYTDRKVAFTDATSGTKIETDFVFPNITFSNVVGE